MHGSSKHCMPHMGPPPLQVGNKIKKFRFLEIFKSRWGPCKEIYKTLVSQSNPRQKLTPKECKILALRSPKRQASKIFQPKILPKKIHVQHSSKEAFTRSKKNRVNQPIVPEHGLLWHQGQQLFFSNVSSPDSWRCFGERSLICHVIYFHDQFAPFSHISRPSSLSFFVVSKNSFLLLL